MSLLRRGENDFKRGDTSQAVHQAAVRKDNMMGLINIQKQKHFYINVQLYTCAFRVIQCIIIVIFTRQEYTKHVIISTVNVGFIFKGSNYPIYSVNSSKILKKFLIETP